MNILYYFWENKIAGFNGDIFTQRGLTKYLILISYVQAFQTKIGVINCFRNKLLIIKKIMKIVFRCFKQVCK